MTVLLTVRPKAMTLITDRLNSTKPPPSDHKPGQRPTAAQLNNNKDLEVDLKKEEPSFFGSFFAAVKGGQKKKGGPTLEAVSEHSSAYY